MPRMETTVRYCDQCGYETRELDPAAHCGVSMLLVKGSAVIDESVSGAPDEADYIDDVRTGAISAVSALRQLSDEFYTVNASLTRIADVYRALDEDTRATEIEVALRIVQEHFAISDDGEFVARSG
jgi:hypothetical protein